jgi:cell division protein FtsL
MNRCVRLVLLLALLPLAGRAQYKEPLSVYKARLDSISNAGDATSDEDEEEEPLILDSTATASAADMAQDSTAYDDADTTTRVAAPHYLWDQEIPVNQDSTNYEDDEGYGLRLREVPASLIKEFKADKELQYKKKKRGNERDFTVVQMIFLAIFMFIRSFYWILIILIVLVLAFILYNYLKGQGYILGRKNRSFDDEVVALSDEELDLSTYEKQIQAAIAAGKLRLAVRLLYLQTLRLLSDKEIISFSKEKTNAAYLRAMAQTAWYKPFANLTLDYEYIWYGEIPVNEAQFDVIHKHFSQFMNELGYTR